MSLKKLVSDKLSRHDIDYVCDLFSPFRLQPSSFLGYEGNSIRSLLGIIIDFVLNANCSLFRFTKSQRLQELFFFALLNGELNSYLEAGANDGLLYSNTYAFYTLLDCRGICIEASPRLYRSLVCNRPNDVNLNYALTSKTGELVSLVDDTPHGLFGHIGNCPDNFVSDDVKSLKELVHSISLNDALANCSLSHVSFMSLDIEGSELNALSVLKAPIFHTACVEANTPAQKYKISQFLKSIGCACYIYPFASNEIVAVSSPLGLNSDILKILDECFVL
jgi:FkbM family methyltransferase